jgi:hypothetical protein
LSLRLAYRVWSSGEKQTISAESLRSSLKIVEGQLQSQFPYTTDDDKEKKIWFAGSRNSLQFATNYSLWGRTRGYLLVTYLIEDTGEHKTLLVYETPAGCQNAKKRGLFGEMDDMYFEYYERPLAEDPRWTDTWTDEKQYPEKIRLHLLSGSEHRIMLIPVRAGRVSHAM